MKWLSLPQSVLLRLAFFLIGTFFYSFGPQFRLCGRASVRLAWPPPKWGRLLPMQWTYVRVDVTGKQLWPSLRRATLTSLTISSCSLVFSLTVMSSRSSAQPAELSNSVPLPCSGQELAQDKKWSKHQMSTHGL